MGGKHFMKDKAFIKTAVRDVKRLERYCDLNPESSLLDWGSGAGRLAIGVKEYFPSIRDYHGVDVQRTLIDWAQENLAGTIFTRANLAFWAPITARQWPRLPRTAPATHSSGCPLIHIRCESC